MPTMTFTGPEHPVSAIAWAIDTDISGHMSAINAAHSDLAVEKHRTLIIGYRPEVEEIQQLPALEVRLSDEADMAHEGALFAEGHYNIVATYYVSDNDPYALWKKRSRTQAALARAVMNNTSLTSTYTTVKAAYMSVPQIPWGQNEQDSWLGFASVVFEVTQDE